MRVILASLKKALFLPLVALLLASPSANANELVLNPGLTEVLNRVLSASDALHRSLISQNEDQIELDLHHLLWQIGLAREASWSVKPHVRGHLLLILDSAQREFELTRSLYGDERRTRLEKGYDQIVNLVRIYRLDRAYSIYYCPDDNTSWVQKSQRAQHGQDPFRPKSLRGCGIKVERPR